MIKLTPMQIKNMVNDQGDGSALDRLMSVRDPDLAWRVHRIAEVLDQALQFFQKHQQKILEGYADPDGNGGWKFYDDEAQREGMEQIVKLSQYEMTFDLELLDRDAAEQAGLAAKDIFALRPLFDVEPHIIEDPFEKA